METSTISKTTKIKRFPKSVSCFSLRKSYFPNNRTMLSRNLFSSPFSARGAFSENNNFFLLNGMFLRTKNFTRIVRDNRLSNLRQLTRLIITVHAFLGAYAKITQQHA